MAEFSAYDGHALPDSWTYMSFQARQTVIDHYNNPMAHNLPFWWKNMNSVESQRVRLHLYQTHAIPGSRSYKAIMYGPSASTPAFVHGQPDHEGPNGRSRNRILPTVYGLLTDQWVTSKRGALLPSQMDRDHLKNTIELLKESHCNTIGRATDLLGRISYHFQNQPHIVKVLESLCESMQEVDVDEMYPIFAKLAEELAERTPRTVTLDIETHGLSINDDLLGNW